MNRGWSEVPATGWVLQSSANTTVNPGAGSASFTNRSTASGAPGGTGGGGAPLAWTGSGHGRWFFAGMLFLAAGLVAVFEDRRRRRTVVAKGSTRKC